MSEKTLKTRIIHKHDTEAHWLLAENFIPKQGELIVYDIDDTHTYERFKIGDGKTLVSELPFASVDTSSLVDLSIEQIIEGKKTFKDLHIAVETNGIVWSEDLITNQTDLSGQTITFDTNRGYEGYDEKGWSWAEGVLLESSGGYKLSMGGPPDLYFIDSAGNETQIYDYALNKWLISSLLLPSDFGYITSFATEYPETVEVKESAIATLNILAPSTSHAKLNLGDTVLIQPEDDGIIATQEWINTQEFASVNPSNLVTLTDEQTLSNKTINRELKFLNPADEVAGAITYGGVGGLACEGPHLEAQRLLARGSMANIEGTAGEYYTLYCCDGIHTSDGKLTFPPQEEGVIATQKWVNEQGFGNGSGNIDTSNLVTLDTEQTISGKKTFSGEIDLTNATVTGLPKLAIEVEELPTENIDDSKIYILQQIENAELYYFGGINYHTLAEVVLDVVGVNPTVNYYVVNELPASGEITDLQTFSVINCYIFNDVAYVYGNTDSGAIWMPVKTIFAQMGNPTEDKGRVYDLTDTSVEVGLYVYYEELPKKFYLYSNNEWEVVSNGIGLTQEKVQTMIDAAIMGALNDEY
jgi:hypothetical protein